MSEVKFVEGAQFSERTPNQPEFLKGRLFFKVEEFKKFLDENVNERGYVNVDVKEGKSGKVYLALNEWKKPEGLTGTVKPAALTTEYPDEEISPEDIPF